MESLTSAYDCYLSTPELIAESRLLVLIAKGKEGV